MKRKAKDAEDKDKLLKRLKEFLNDLDEGRVDVRQPLDETDGVGECLADLHHKYLHLLKDLENERKKGKQQQKQVLLTKIPSYDKLLLSCACVLIIIFLFQRQKLQLMN